MPAIPSWVTAMLFPTPLRRLDGRGSEKWGAKKRGMNAVSKRVACLNSKELGPQSLEHGRHHMWSRLQTEPYRQRSYTRHRAVAIGVLRPTDSLQRV